jgi:hypothetical protein
MTSTSLVPLERLQPLHPMDHTASRAPSVRPHGGFCLFTSVCWRVCVCAFWKPWQSALVRWTNWRRLTNLPVAGLQRLLQSALALRLLDLRSEGRYGLGALGAPVAGHVGIRAMIEHHAVLYQDMQDPVAMLKGTEQPGAMSQYWPYTIEEQNAQRVAKRCGAS